jgi:NhaP-type Na+/H+ and K+/H+ antiporter
MLLDDDWLTEISSLLAQGVKLKAIAEWLYMDENDIKKALEGKCLENTGKQDLEFLGYTVPIWMVVVSAGIKNVKPYTSTQGSQTGKRRRTGARTN